MKNSKQAIISAYRFVYGSDWVDMINFHMYCARQGFHFDKNLYDYYPRYKHVMTQKEQFEQTMKQGKLMHSNVDITQIKDLTDEWKDEENKHLHQSLPEGYEDWKKIFQPKKPTTKEILTELRTHFRRTKNWYQGKIDELKLDAGKKPGIQEAINKLRAEMYKRLLRIEEAGKRIKGGEQQTLQL